MTHRCAMKHYIGAMDDYGIITKLNERQLSYCYLVVILYFFMLAYSLH